MQRPLVSLVSLSLLLAVAAPTAAARDRRALDDEPRFINGRLVLPAWQTSWEKRMLLRKDSEGQLNAFRTAHPELYGVTLPPVQPVRFYAEYDPVDAIYYAWEPGTFDDFFYAITDEIVTRTTITVYILHHGAQERADLEQRITSRGGDPTSVTFIDVATLGDYYVWQSEWPYDRSLESFWTVDFGPWWVADGTGTLSIIDPRYYPWRVNDDAVPAKLANALGVNVFRPDLSFEGGNLLSDGLGTCFGTGVHVAYNAPYTQDEIDDMLFDYYGCEKMFWLEPMFGEGTGHADMFFKNASATTLIVGEYDAAVDPANAAVLDYNANMLASETNAAGEPFEVLRVPMPPASGEVYRSYTNGIVVNDLVLVPVYSNHTSQEAEALAVFEQAFPGRTVVGIDSEDVIDWGGAIHCVTRTRPAGTLAQMETPPADQCGGDYSCAGGCGDYDLTGECVYGHPVYCDGGTTYAEDCYGSERCGWSLADGYFWCVTSGCGSLPDEGQCETTDEGREVAVTCVDGYPMGEICPTGTSCALDSTVGRVGCHAPCDDDCTAGDAGCDADGNPWSCGEAGDGDVCLEVVTGSCAEGEACVDGECSCTDECEMGEGGCDEDGNSWVCGEAYDGDSCRERIVVPCEGGYTCKDGTCNKTGCGCTAGGPADLGGLLLLLVGLLLANGARRRRRDD